MAKLKKDKETSPLIQKIVLLVFGVGPILIMIIFLSSRGFFG
tara:strand:+ start:1384 stop:1509 length:126 start_codon:yes stop_codon:yes gene_type:complete